MALDRLKTYDIQLTGGVDFPVNVDGDVFFLHSASFNIDIIFDEENVFKTQREGAKINFSKPYNRVIISSSTSQNIRCIFGYGDFDNTVEQVNAILVPNTTIEALADVTVTSTAAQLVAQNALRRALGITIPDTADTGIRIGDSGMANSGEGQLLLPGTTHYLVTTAQIYAVIAGSTNIAVTISEYS